ncbi:MAG: ABC transporter ATP-binding protein, partial [Thermoprotei archaeon]
MSLLKVRDLTVEYSTVYGTLRAINRLSLDVGEGDSLGVVGESGSGKSTLGLSIVRLLPPNARYAAGSIQLDGQEVTRMSNAEARRIRGTTAFMIFQDPLNSLNPVKKVATQLLEAVEMRCKKLGETYDVEQAHREVVERIRDVRIPDPELIMERYPHQLSGGQIQRVIIAMALLMRPKLLIADEPTSALDVTIQAQVLKLMNDLKKEYGMSIIFITHDISVAYNISDRIMVMYAGELVELGSTEGVIRSPMHPYAKALISSIPRGMMRSNPLEAISGSPPNMIHPPSGCRFHPRCPYVMDICRREEP